VELAEERLLFWSQLRQIAGLQVEDTARGVVEADLEEQFEAKLGALRAEYEGKLAELKASFPPIIARKMAEGLVRAGNGQQTIADLLARVQTMPGLKPITADVMPESDAIAAPAPVATGAGSAVAGAPAAAPVAVEEAEEGLGLEPYIESARCTACNECTNLNRKMFAYNDKKQAYIQDPKAGTFKDLVMAAERCSVRIIHPGTPLNPKEKNLEKWIKRAEPFN
jgi:pyruvate-ferredoxin/flavodoxin oxidoreductase